MSFTIVWECRKKFENKTLLKSEYILNIFIIQKSHGSKKVTIVKCIGLMSLVFIL